MKKNTMNLFPFGSYFLVQIEKGKKELEPIKLDVNPDWLKKVKKSLYLVGKDQGTRYLVAMTGVSNTGFGITKKNIKPERFFWNYVEGFVVEVVKTLEEIKWKEKPRVAKVYLVLTSGTSPYYYHHQKKRELTVDNITKKEINFIKIFEEGLGILFDYEKKI